MSSKFSAHRLQVLILVGIVLVGGFFLYLDRTNQTLSSFSLMQLFTVDFNYVRVGDISLEVEVANNPEARTRGLSGRSEIGDAQGMLFVFPEPGYHGIWMPDMQFPIDVIWVDENFKVVDLTPNLSPSTYPKVFEPQKPVKYVIETDVLFIETFGVAVGQTVHIPEALQESR